MVLDRRVLACLLLVPFLSAAAPTGTAFFADDSAVPRVPGTSQPDRYAHAERTWMLDEARSEPPHRWVLEGTSHRMQQGAIAAQVFSELGTLEAVLVERDESRGDGHLRAVFNVGAVLSSLRFDPPLGLNGTQVLTLDVPRLDWSPPTMTNRTYTDNETGVEHRLLRLETIANVPLADENGTSPPIGPPNDRTPSRLHLTWHLQVTDHLQPGPHGEHSPAAIRFFWTLEGENEDALPSQQAITWVFLYDYDTLREVERPERDPRHAFDGAYLHSGDHRAALRLSTVYFPLPPIPDDSATKQSTTSNIPLEIDIRPHRGGPGPTPEPTRIPSPLILEAHTPGADAPSRGHILTGELSFYRAAEEDPPDNDDGPPLAPDGPMRPQLWQILLVVALALGVLVPRIR